MLPQVSEETGYPLLALPLRLGSAYRCCGHEISSFSVASVSNIKTELFANSIKYIELALLFCEFIINHFSVLFHIKNSTSRTASGLRGSPDRILRKQKCNNSTFQSARRWFFAMLFTIKNWFFPSFLVWLIHQLPTLRVIPSFEKQAARLSGACPGLPFRFYPESF